MNRADRRFRRQRKINRAKKMLRIWGLPEAHAPYWADNMAKCSCWMCTAPSKAEPDYSDYDAAREWE